MRAPTARRATRRSCMADGRHKPLADLRPSATRSTGPSARGAYRRYVPTEVLAPLVDGEARLPGRRSRTAPSWSRAATTASSPTRGWKHVTGAEQRRRSAARTSRSTTSCSAPGGSPPAAGHDRRLPARLPLRDDPRRRRTSARTPTSARPGARRRPPVPARARRRRGARSRPATTCRGSRSSDRRVRVRGGRRRHARRSRRSARRRGAQVERIRDAHRAGPRSRATTGARGSSPASSTPRAVAASGVLRICNTDADDHRLDRRDCLRRFGFDAVVEERRHASQRPRYVRLRGGLREHLRFFHTVDPAITRKRDHRRDRRSRPTRRCASRRSSRSASAMRLYDITTGTGDFIANGVVSHNCFARPTHTYLDFDAGRDFEREIVVKVNAPEVAAARSWRGRRGRASTSRWGRTPIRTSGSRGATSSCPGSGRRCGTPAPLLDPHEVAAAAARHRPPEGDRASVAGIARQPLDPDARREGLAGDRAAHAATRGRGSRRSPSSTGPASPAGS